METELRTLHVQRGSIKFQLTCFNKFFSKVREQDPVLQTGIDELQARLMRIEELWETFNNLQIQIETIATDIDCEYEQRELFQDSYFSLTSEAKRFLSEYVSTNDASQGASLLHSASIVSQNSPKQNIRLPTINLPTFDGNFVHWREFFDTFKAIIHSNNDIGDSQKLCYLRASLKGEAANVVQSFETSDANYSIVWKLLQERYDNRRRIVLSHSRALLEISAVSKESHVAYRQLIDTLQRHLRCLSALEQPIDSWDAILVPLISSKLDPITNREWETKINSESSNREHIPTVTELITFLTYKHDTLEALVTNKLQVESDSNQNRPSKGDSNKPVQKPKKSYVSSSPACTFCKGAHYINSCSEFLKLPSNTRLERIKKLSLCINCLNRGHQVANCVFGTCKKCHAKHHTLLHFENIVPPPIQENPQAQTSALSSQTNMTGQVLLATASVQVVDSNGKLHIARVLLDSGSQSNFISAEFCDLLKLKRIQSEIAIIGISQVTSNSNWRCDIQIHSRFSNFNTTLSCIILPQICDRIPSSRVDRTELHMPKYIKLADPQFDRPGKIDILLGADCFWQLLCVGQIKLGAQKPILQKTLLGWVLSGPIHSNNDRQTYCHFIKNYDIQEQLAKFWEIEEVSTNKKPLSIEEKKCEAHFSSTYKRNAEGRFIVSIPFKDTLHKLGDSLEMAKKRFYALERKFQRNNLFKLNYVAFIKEYISMGHMTLIEHKHNTEHVYYLPHHGVINESSVTTKLRVVFDGSCPTTSGISINELQMVGPTVQNDLISILLRFRQYQIVISADIAKMYRQVQINPNQRSLQRIVWRYDSALPLQKYELNTVTYGTASASFLAIRSLHELSIQNKAEFPKASEVIENDFYVDDLLTGADSVEEAVIICEQVSDILKQGCFELRKWISNDPHIFKDFPNLDTKFETLEFGLNENSKTLGLIWSCRSDHLVYNIGSNDSKGAITKRIILSVTSQIFDPLGLLSACTINAKIILQRLWLEKISWDESVSAELHTKWFRLREELSSLNDLKIPRLVVCKNPIRLELHAFSDSSAVAYGACIYIRGMDSYDNISVNLLCAKSKVAPLKTLSIPRLELSAALVSTRLSEKVITSSNLQFKQYFWSDSNIVLAWIGTPPNLLKTFVANRISEIQEKTDTKDWRHVGTNDNPADLLSRGVSPANLKALNIWWHGPSWLLENERNWPSNCNPNALDLPELKSQSKTFLVVHDYDIFTKFSSLRTLQRVTSYCFRFYNNLRVSKSQRHFQPLSTSELRNALNRLIRLAQEQCFQAEISCLTKNKPLKAGSNILRLNPFIDESGILRVGGRLKISNLAFEKRHPAILPPKHELSYLIARQEHMRLLHCGPQTLLNSMRENYWPIAGRNLTRKVVHQCVVCFKTNPKPIKFLMGNLPRDRVTPAPPFFTTGIDYAGPFLIRDRRSRGYKSNKSYICLFICLVTKAIHLELVGDLTSEGFIAALRRFTARRGKPAHIYSDNGTNFVGANNELKDLGKFLLEHEVEIVDTSAVEGVDWHFIPAHSPHFGGLWEAGVKSVKQHLRRVIGNALLTYEDFNTVLAQIESILNSRPLSPLSSDPNDMNPLTPGHFLIGRSLTALPDPSLQDIAENRLSRFQLLQKLSQHFWTRWSKEYVSQLQERTKWLKNQPNIQLGTLVLIKDDNLPPLCWRLGRIIELHPGLDNVVRVVSIKTVKGIIKRAVTKISPFPNQD